MRALSLVMRNTILTTQTKRYTVRTVNRGRPFRQDSTLSAGTYDSEAVDTRIVIFVKKQKKLLWGVIREKPLVGSRVVDFFSILSLFTIEI